MNKIIFILTLGILTSLNFQAQILIDPTVTAENAVNDILLGAGVVALNITYSGDLNQIGSFSSNGSNMPIGEGVILGTGNVNFASSPDFFDEDLPGPGGNNNTGGSAGGGNVGVNDADLEIIANVNVNDAAILEFDFEATGDSIQFNFVFASEEYPEYACGTVNDAFGFFLSGPGIDGGGIYDLNAVNLAQIPGTVPPVPVTINSVNPGVVGNFGTAINCDNIDENWPDYNVFYIANDGQTADPNVIEYDGFTVVLTAKAQVECGETYHIKMAIADGGDFDTAFDSAVFLQAGSFESNALQVTSSAAIAGNLVFGGDSIVVEGCNDAQFSFFRPNSFEADTIRFEILGQAENGVDYTEIADSIILEAGENQGFISLSALDDDIEEDFEDIIIQYVFENSCGGQDTVTSRLYIADNIDPTVSLEDVTLPCPGEPIEITPETTGFGGFTYQWSDNSQNGTLSVTPDVTTTYDVTVTDVCGMETTGQVTVSVVEWPELVLTPVSATSTCPGDEIQISVIAEGGSPGYTYEWVGSNETSDTFTVNPNITTNFGVFVSDQCETAQILVPAEVIPWPGLDIISNGGSSECPGSPVDINVDVSGGFPGYTYNWIANGDTTSNTTFSPNTSGNFTVTVSDECSSQDADVFIDVAVLDDITTLYDDTLCVGETSPFINLTGGTNSYSFSTFLGSGEPQPTAITVAANSANTSYLYTGNSPGLFEVIITDDCPSVLPFTALILLEPCTTVIPNVFTPNDDPLDLNETFQIQGLEAFPNSSITIYNRWGGIVYEDSSYNNNNAWDGRDISGDKLANGTYFYIFNRSDGESFEGTLTIFR